LSTDEGRRTVFPMYTSPPFGLLRCLILVLAISTTGTGLKAQAAAIETPLYTTGPASSDGIGKFYYGREIAHFMTHEGAAWLERPEREKEERPDLLIKTLQLRQGDVVADIGCGSGYFSWRLGQAVGDRGIVYGVEIQPEMLQLLDTKMRERRALNVLGVLGTPQTPNLPERVDLVLMVDVYHEMSHPAEMMEAICYSLKPGGRLVLVEYRAEDSKVAIKPLHKMSESQIKKEMADLPLQYVETVHTLPQQHVLIFRRKAR
jgi:SAM-dependent methyltransferase